MGRQRPTGIILVAIWFFLEGASSAISGFLSALSIEQVFGWVGLGLALAGVGTGGAIGTLRAILILIGLVLAVAGIGYIITGYLLLQGDERGRKWGIITSAVAGAAWIVFGIAMWAAFGALASTAAIAFAFWGILNLLPILYLMGDEARNWCGAGGGGSLGLYGGGGYQPPVDPTKAANQPSARSDRYTRPVEHAPVQRTKLVDEQPAPTGWLVVRSGQRANKQFGLSPSARNTLGRDGSRSDLVLDDPAVSGEHARVQWEHGQFVIYDLASRNHTFVNGHQVQKQTLMDGDIVRIGDTTMVFKSVR